MLCAMPKIVFDMVAFSFQDIDALVLDLPAGAPKVTNIFHAIFRDVVVGCPTVVKQNLAVPLMVICRSHQLTNKASSPPRIGIWFTQRQRQISPCFPFQRRSDFSAGVKADSQR